MTKWQHFLHAFSVHDWHKVHDFEAEILVEGHGNFNPHKTERCTFVRRICCHCGKTEIVSYREFLGI